MIQLPGPGTWHTPVLGVVYKGGKMSHILTISDTLYTQLELVRRRGLASIEQLFELWQSMENEIHQRQEAVRGIDALRERLFAPHCEMPDSSALIRAER
jgi:hypothetical protein